MRQLVKMNEYSNNYDPALDCVNEGYKHENINLQIMAINMNKDDVNCPNKQTREFMMANDLMKK